MKLRQSIFFIVWLSLFLSSCSWNFNAAENDSFLTKMRQLPSPRFLTETRYMTWLNTPTEILSLDRPGTAKGCDINQDCFPTLKAYQQHAALWHTWRARKKTQVRIIDLLPKGTEFHFYKVDVPDNKLTGIYIFYATIDSGPYQGMSVYYKYDESDAFDAAVIQHLQ